MIECTMESVSKSIRLHRQNIAVECHRITCIDCGGSIEADENFAREWWRMHVNDHHKRPSDIIHRLIGF